MYTFLIYINNPNKMINEKKRKLGFVKKIKHKKIDKKIFYRFINKLSRLASYLVFGFFHNFRSNFI